MDVGEGVSLLLRGHSDQDIEQHSTIASEIVHRLGGLPLAIDQAAAYIRYQRLPLHQLDRFLSTYNRRSKEILSHIPPSFWEYGTTQIHGGEERNKALSAFTTWEMSLEQLKTNDSHLSNEMTHILTLSALFNPARIEEWLFRHYSERYHSIEDCASWEQLLSVPDGESIDGSHGGSGQGSDNEWYHGSDNSPDQGGDDASNLESNDKMDDETYDDRYNSSLSDHASNANSFGHECDRRWSSAKFLDVLSKINDLSLIQSLERPSEGAIFSLHPLIRDWLQLRDEKYSPQKMIIESVAVVASSVELDQYQPMSLEQRTSLLAHIDVCLMSDDKYTEEHHRLGYDLQNCGNAYLLANFYGNQGRYEAAEKLHHRISATQTKSLGMEHMDTLRTNNSLGISLYGQGKYDEAERIQRHTVQLQKRVLGEKDQSTLFSLQSLAWTFRAQTKYNEAENIQRQLLQSYEKISGKRNVDTLRCSGALADTLRLQGKFAEAEKMLREALQLSETVSGGQHRAILSAMSSLAITLQDQCKYKEAEPLGRNVLQFNERVYGKQHPNTLSTMHNLAMTLFYLDKVQEAVKLCREALRLHETAMGKNHPNTLATMHNFAWMLSREESSYEEAKQLCGQAVALRKEVLGSEHRKTLISLGLLGRILSKHTSTHHEAEQILRETYQLRKRVLGSEHPHMMFTMHDLGWILSQRESSYDEGEKILCETFILQKKVLGSEHPDTLRTRRALAKVLQLQGKCDDAEETSQQIVNIEAQMKTASDDSFKIESSGESAPLPGQVETLRKRKRWLSSMRRHFGKG